MKLQLEFQANRCYASGTSHYDRT